MSKDSKNPTNSQKGKNTPPSKPQNDQTEDDLWDLDEEKDPETELPPKQVEPASIPSPRAKESPIESRKPVDRNVETPVLALEIDDDETEESSEKEEASDPPESEKSTEKKSSTPSKKTKEDDDDEIESTTSTSETADPSPVITGKSYISSLSKIEKIGIVALVAILCLTAALSIVHFSNNLEIKSLIADDLELPIEGELVSISSVETYWREPISEGENKDVVRRGVHLIPAVQLDIESTSSGSSAIRVLFRDADELVVGDNISRSIPNQGKMEISATDGFNDLGMHAAYRTGESARWTVQVLEGPSINAPIEKFKTLFETEISTHMR